MLALCFHVPGGSTALPPNPRFSAQLTAELGSPPGLHHVASILAGLRQGCHMDTHRLLQPLVFTHVKHAVVEEERGHEMRQACPAERGHVRGSKGQREKTFLSWRTPNRTPTPILPPFILKGSMEDYDPSTELWPR